MSVPNDPGKMSENTPKPVTPQPLVPRAQERAVEHRSALERGEQDELYGTMLTQAAHFSHFPLARVKGDEWTRQNAWGEIAIDAGRVAEGGKGSKRAAVPFGGLPRLLNTHITTQARRIAKEGGDPSRLDLTGSLNSMVKELGLSEGSRNQALMDAIESTLSARVTFTRTVDAVHNGERGKWRDSVWLPPIATSLHLWVPNQQPLEGFEPYITLSKEYLETILDDANVMPVRTDLLAKLVGKPMAFDVLPWLQTVIYSLHRSGQAQRFFPWPDLYATFTHEYARVNDFATYWKRALTEALRYYPEARVELVRGSRGKAGGVIVKSSPLLVQQKRNQIAS